MRLPKWLRRAVDPTDWKKPLLAVLAEAGIDGSLLVFHAAGEEWEHLYREHEGVGGGAYIFTTDGSLAIEDLEDLGNIGMNDARVVDRKATVKNATYVVVAISAPNMTQEPPGLWIPGGIHVWPDLNPDMLRQIVTRAEQENLHLKGVKMFQGSGLID